MGWRSWPYWLKGGLISVIIGIVFYLIFFFSGAQFRGIFQIIGVVYSILAIPANFVSNSLILTWLIYLLTYFIVGTIIGWIIGKAKSSK